MNYKLYDRAADFNVPDVTRTIEAWSDESLVPKLNSDITEGRESAVAAPGNIIIFSGNMSADHKDYVTNSLLFSDLAAVQKTKTISHPLQRRKDWYDEKTRIMKGLGWSGFSESLRAFRATSTQLTMDQAGLEILGMALAAAAVPGLTAVVVAKLAKDAVDKLREGGEPLRLFQSETRDHHDGNFNISVCMESAEGDVIMVSTNIYFIATHSVTNILFWEWQRSEVDVASAGNKLVLNEGRFKRGQQQLADRLDEYLFDNILSLPLRD